MRRRVSKLCTRTSRRSTGNCRGSRRVERKIEVEATRKKFLGDPYKFSKRLLESHLAKTYKDAMRDKVFPQPGLQRDA